MTLPRKQNPSTQETPQKTLSHFIQHAEMWQQFSIPSLHAAAAAECPAFDFQV